MMRFHRSALFAGLLAIGVAACGDDVQVVDPPPPPPPPLSVSVSPQNQNILVGQTADFTVNVSGGVEGEEASWTCTSGNTSVAGSVQVTSTGCRVTGAGEGSTTVTAVVTKGTLTAQAGGQVSVSEDPSEPATVTISSLTQQNVSANIMAIRGQLDVTMNVVANDETPTKLTLWLGGVEVASQTWGPGAEIQEIEGPDEQIVQQITLSFLTDRYGGMFPGEEVTGQAWHLNGLHEIQATLEVAERPGDPIASNSFELNLANFNRVHISEVGPEDHQTKLPTNSALDSAGNIWYGGPDSGPVEFRAVPVVYQPMANDATQAREVASLTMNLCGPAILLTEEPFDFSFACAATQTTVDGISPSVSGGAAMGTDGNPIVFGGSALTPVPNEVPEIVGPHPFPIRIDKVAPEGGSLRIATQTSIGNRENWVNGMYAFSTGYSNATDTGVGCVSAGCEVSFIVREDDAQGDVVAEGITTAASLDNTVTNAEYFLQAEVRDRLGNTATINSTVAADQDVTNPAPTSHTLATFGVDKEAPVVFSGTGANRLAADTVINTVGADQIELRATDVISGFADAPVGEGLRHSFTRVLGTAGSSTLTREHIVGGGMISATPFETSDDGDWIVATPSPVTTYVQAFNALQFDLPLALALPGSPDDFGYYIYQGEVRDKAGNVAEELFTRRVYVSDNSIPVMTGLVAQGTFIGGQSVTFPGSAEDQVEVHQGSFAINYPTLDLKVLYERPNPLVDPLFDDTIDLPAAVDFTTDFFIRSLSIVTADAAATPPLEEVGGHEPGAAGPVRPNFVEARVYNGLVAGLATPPTHFSDFANSVVGVGSAAEGASGFLTAGILPTSVATGLDFASTTDFPDGTVVQQHYIRPEYSIVQHGDGTATVTFTVRTVGAAPNFMNPYASQVIVERGSLVDADLFEYITPIGDGTPQFTAPFPTGTIGNNQLRYYEWSFSVTRPNNIARAYHGVGVTSNGDGLATRGFAVDFTLATGTYTGTYF